MKPVDQTIVDNGKGDCMRAVCASLFEIDINQVPNFIEFDRLWYFLMSMFFTVRGYKIDHNCYYPESLTYENSIGGYFYASVPSKTYKGVRHAVVIDMNGVIVHDPNPNKLWQGLSFYNNEDDGGRYFHTFKLINKNQEIPFKKLDICNTL